MQLSEIVTELLKLPDQMSNFDEMVAGNKKTLKDLKASLDHIKENVIASRSDWGKNAEDRGHNQAVALRNSQNYQSVLRSLANEEYDLALAEVEAKRLQNLFYAYRSIAEITAASLLSGRSIVSNGNGEKIATATELGL